MIQHIITKNNITIYINNKPFMCSNNHKNYNKIIELLKTNDIDLTYLEQLFSIENVISNSSNKINIKDNKIFYNETELNNFLIDKILNLIKEDKDVNYLILFLDNLYKNKNINEIDNVLNFIKNNNLPISKDGYFYSYFILNENTYLIDNKYSIDDFKIGYNTYIKNNQTLSFVSYNNLIENKESILYANMQIFCIKINPLNILSIKDNIGYTDKFIIVDNITNKFDQINILDNSLIYNSDLEIEIDEANNYLDNFN